MGIEVTQWEPWWPGLYTQAEAPVEYPGGSDSYKLAGEFLAGDDLVEEWGCATTYGRQFIDAPYRGVDGGPSKFVDVVADLRQYKSEVPNAIIRHVLEHNWEWRTILSNFIDSFQRKAAIILFIPMGVHDINRSFNHVVGQQSSPPGLQMDEDSFWHTLYRAGMTVQKDFELQNDTPPFGYERLIFLEKGLGSYVPTPQRLPRCVYCDNAGFEQLRIELTLLGDRYEMAANACANCMQKAHDDLYSLTATPAVSFE